MLAGMPTLPIKVILRLHIVWSFLTLPTPISEKIFN